MAVGSSGHDARSNVTSANASVDEIEDWQGAIAVVGLSMEFPLATSTDAFWELLLSGRSAAREFPPDRLHQDAWHNARGSSQGSIRPKRSYFLDRDIAAFDAPFFSITESEAAAMDPQQRGLLETSYKALENAGITMSRISGSDTSVFTGYFTADYLLLSAKDPEKMPKYGATGFAGAMLSNRISSFFNLTGPSITIDTACSSSLVALDMACQSLRCGESSMAIVTGCNLIHSLDLTIGLSNMGFLSPDGEGFGALIIKPIQEALRDGDTIRAVIRATASNQNGRTNLAHPSREAQTRLIRETYRRARLDMSVTQYVETHGTGTATGDPIEAAAVGEAFRTSRRDQQNPIFIGASKANIGHLEGTSGIAGVVKAILVLEKAVIPPIATLSTLNPAIDSEFLGLEFPTKPHPWPTKGLRRVSVNSFGFGGTNSHAVLDDTYHFLKKYGLKGNHNTTYESVENGTTLTNGDFESHLIRPYVFVWSAGDEEGVSRLASAYQSYLLTATDSECYLRALASTLSKNRTLLPWRTFAIASSLHELLEKMISLPRSIHAKPDRQLGYVFTGQGANWLGMGSELLTYPVFRHSIESARAYLGKLESSTKLACDARNVRKTCLQLIFGSSSQNLDINDPQYSQPACTILQVALVDLLHSFNIKPSVVVGHSSGEIAAAYAAGAINCESAWKLAYYRGVYSSSLYSTRKPSGGMIAAALSRDMAQSYIDRVIKGRTSDILCVACINSPNNVTISGDPDCISLLKNLLDEKGIFNRRLPVPVAYHSSQMEKIAITYEQSIGLLERQTEAYQTIPIISTVTGGVIDPNALLEPAYWVRNLVSPVQFVDAIKVCCAVPRSGVAKKIDLSHRSLIGVTDLIEIGPHSALKAPIRETLISNGRENSISYTATLFRNTCGRRSIMEAMGTLHCLDYAVDITRINNMGNDENIDPPPVLPLLPEYPFNHTKKYWSESRISKNIRFRKHGMNDFLGSPVADWNPLEPRWRWFITSSPTGHSAWVGDHKINGDTLFPAAGMLVMAIEAAAQLSHDSGEVITAYELKNVDFVLGLTIPTDDEGIETHIRFKKANDSLRNTVSGYEFSIYAFGKTMTAEVCRGWIQTVAADDGCVCSVGSRETFQAARNTASNIRNALQTCARYTSAQALYSRLYRLGYHFGGSFQRLKDVWYKENGEAVGNVIVFEDPVASPTVIHPATLDGILQMMLPAATSGKSSKFSTMIPTHIDHLWISSAKALSTLQAHVTLHQTSSRSNKSSICALDYDRGNLIVDVRGIETSVVADGGSARDGSDGARRLCFDIAYKPDISFLDNYQLHQLLARKTDCEKTSELWKDIHSFIVTLMGSIAKDMDMNNIPPASPHLTKQLSWIREHPEKCMDGDLKTLGEKIQRQGRLGEIYGRFGYHLKSILKGEVDALEQLSQDNMLQDYYSITNASWGFIEPLKSYFELISHKNPGMKILEVGAGTGSTTTHVLESLVIPSPEGYSTKYARYDFTDVTHSFLSKAEDRFRAYPKIHYGIFDMEREPDEQGYEVETYDVIVAANAIHATKSIHGTLQSLRKALKPDGKLLIIEIVKPRSVLAPIIFGCLPGWWQGQDSYRTQSPCISEQQWDCVLRESGFSGTDIVFRDYESEYHFVSLMISTATSTQIPEETSIPFRVISGFDTFVDTALLQSVTSRINRADTSTGSFLDASLSDDLSDRVVTVMCDPSWPKLDHLDEQQFSAFRSVLTRSKALLWISDTTTVEEQCPQYALITGFARSLRLERHGLVFTTIELADIDGARRERAITHAIQNTLQGVESGAYEPELLLKDGVLSIPRVYEDHSLNTIVHAKATNSNQAVAFGDRNLTLKVQSPGLLESLNFEEVNGHHAILHADELEIEVRAVGVNFKDVLVAMGHVKDDTFGTECSGTVLRAGSACEIKPGDTVIVCHLDAFRSTIRCRESAVAKMPAGMTFVEAASIPTNFITAYRALIDVARLAANESVLIHAGAGGTGQAAIQVALYCGAEVYVTVGSSKKRKLIEQHYGIPSDRILFSRDTSFANEIQRLTGGKGVDVVLNSLAGPSLLASWECVAPYGRFIEIGKRDILSRRYLPMTQFEQNVTFSAIDIAAMSQQRPDLVCSCLREVVRLFRNGNLKMVKPMKVFPISHVEAAFRYLQSGKEAGKVVVEVDSKTVVQAMIKKKGQLVLNPKGTYVVAGGLGGQGRSVALWLVSKGARHLLLLSRRGTSDSNAIQFVSDLVASGIDVHAPTCDITDSSTLKRVLEECQRSMPPIKGCIQSSMVIRDVAFEKMSQREWNEALLPKVTGSWNLHSLLPRRMDFFVFLSSITGIIGSQIQSNYSAGNTFEDALAHYRISRGERATSINLSAMESEGILADHRDVFDQIVNVKQLLPMSQAELFAILDEYCLPTATRGQVVTGLELPDVVAAKGAQEPAWMREIMFSQLHQSTSTLNTKEERAHDTNNQDLYGIIQNEGSIETATTVLVTAIQDKVCKFLSLTPASFDISKPLHNYGIDSLIAMELRNWFLRILKTEVSVFDILGGVSTETLASSVLVKLRL